MFVTLYLLVLDKRLRRPGTEQNTSFGEPIMLRPLWSFLISGKNGGESVRREQVSNFCNKLIVI